MTNEPNLLTGELHDLKKANHEWKWRKIAKEYYLRKPRPSTTMFKLEEIHKVFELFITWMEKTPGEVMSDSAYSNCRSAILSLFRMFQASSERFQEEA